MSITRVYELNPFRYSDLADKVSLDTGSFVRAGTLYYRDDDGIYQSVAANTPAYLSNGLITLGAYVQWSQDSEDSREWGFSNTTVLKIGESQGFNIVSHTDTVSNSDGRWFY